MFIKKTYNKILIVVILSLLSAGISFSYEEDGFDIAKKIEGKHFDIYYEPQLEIASLIQQLNISPSDKILIGRSTNQDFFSDAGLSDMVDTLFIQVCDILDMPLYSFRGTIKICQDYEQLDKIYSNLFNKDLQKQRSFYVSDLNTIYISRDSFKREILGHEMAHAIISHYFVVLPPVKIQEVLSMYVEYQLRKRNRTSVK